MAVSNIKFASKSTLERLVANMSDMYLKKTDATNYTYTIAKGETADGFASTYVLKSGDTIVGTPINIPKDIFVQDVSQTPVTVTEADKPVVGYKVGDKYIDFTIATSKDASDAKHLYLLLADMCDEYLGDDKAIVLDTTTNKFSLKVDTPNANGLEVTASGVKLNLSTTTSAGAMSATDKVKVDAALTNENFEEITNAEIDAMFNTGA